MMEGEKSIALLSFNYLLTIILFAVTLHSLIVNIKIKEWKGEYPLF